MVRLVGIPGTRQWLRRFVNLTGNLTAFRGGEILVRSTMRFVCRETGSVINGLRANKGARNINLTDITSI